MNQRDEYVHELISAHLDGELSPDERARVAQLLASSEAHRRTLDDFASLSHDMHALPTCKLDERFSRRVLDAARQACPTLKARSELPSGQESPRSAAAARRGWQAGLALVVAAAAALLWGQFVGVDDKQGGAARQQLASSSTDIDSPLPPVLSPQGPLDVQVAPPMADAAPRPLLDPPADGLERSAPPSPEMALDGSQRESTARDDPLEHPSQSAARRTTDQGDVPALVAGRQEDGKGGTSLPSVSSAATRESQPPGPASAVAASSADEPAMSASNMLGGPLLGSEQILFVIDVELTRVGAEQGGFERALNSHGIAFDTSVEVKPDLEDALLKSRFFEPVEPLERPRDEHPFTLVYVVAQGEAIDQLWASMQENQAVFSHVALDLAIRPGDLAVFQQLQQLVSLDPELTSNSSDALLTPDSAVAHRLMLPESWRGRPVAAPQGLGDLAAAASEIPTQPSAGLDVQGDAAAWAQRGLGQAPIHGLPGGLLRSEALFVVHATSDGSR